MSKHELEIEYMKLRDEMRKKEESDRRFRLAFNLFLTACYIVSMCIK